ncbi:kinase-like domain-containing protein [Aspergillus avenaceus]|uniref:Kinase-like domain-containing protein n=1 Tax=Aspergillus avenaceus TaxID=36643 RepID=A0A5N6TIY1_ASPAV|nr:kinase-like domain-containing protein [Aspergillus avenaceus]
MSLIEGETLQERWSDMNEDERQSVCQELKHMVEAWRTLAPDDHSHGCYVGSMGGHPLNDIFISSHPELTGPFQGAAAVQQFQDACGIEIHDNVPVVFTHSDLVPPDIMLSPGPNPRVAAVIDWGQAGWYPAYWEYCKARRVNLLSERFDVALLEEWRARYLPMIMPPVDEEAVYHPWLYFVLSKGI